MWYRHNGRGDGQGNWAAGAGNKVGQSWGLQQLLVSDGAVLYAIMPDGALRWYKHAGVGSGSFQWGAGTGNTVGSGWGDFKHVVAAAGGVFYAVNAKDQLLWFKHTGRDSGTSSWAPGTGNVVGTGWGGFKHVFAQNAQQHFSANITLDGQDRPMDNLPPEMYHIQGGSSCQWRTVLYKQIHGAAFIS